MNKIVTMREALASPDLFGALLGGETWAAWRVLLIATMGEELTEAERVVLFELTGRYHEPTEPVDEFWGIIGRRGGKTRAIAVLASYLAALVDHRHALAPGQWALLPVMAASVRQAQEAFNYINGAFTEVPRLARLVETKTADTLSLKSRVTIEVRPASFRTVRGFTAIGAIADEIAFWRVDDTANPDKEILAALRPALATTGGPLIAISSPYARRGELFKAFVRHHGPDGDPRVLVAKAPSKVMNSSLRQAVIDRAYEDDPAVAAAEYGAEFRTDVESFINQDLVNAAIVPGRSVLPFSMGLDYQAFVDAAGGSGADSFTLAIAHSEDMPGTAYRKAVLDFVAEVKPPFSPDDVTKTFAGYLADYGLFSVTGDAYGGEWPRERFRQNGVTYEVSSDRDSGSQKPLYRSEIYKTLLPMLNAGRVELLENKRLVSQLCALERRTTRSGNDSVNHPPGGNDDVINAAAGALVLAGAKLSNLAVWERLFD